MGLGLLWLMWLLSLLWLFDQLHLRIGYTLLERLHLFLQLCLSLHLGSKLQGKLIIGGPLSVC